MERLVRNPEKSLFLLATAVRLSLVWMLVGPYASGVYTYEHGEIAGNLLAGRGFSVKLLGTWGPTSQQAPLVPFLLAGCYAMLGVGTSAAIWLFLGLQCIEGGLTAVGARRLSARAGLSPVFANLAGLGAAFFPPLVYSASHVQVASTACLLLVWLFDSLMQLRNEPKMRNALKAAILMALAVLTDPILVLSGVATTFCWITFDRPAQKMEFVRLVKSWTVLVFCSVLLISPWLFRGYRVHGRPVFIKSTFGYAFWQGNNRLSVGTDKVMRESVQAKLAEGGSSLAGLDKKLWEARHAAGCIDDIALTDTQKKELGQLPELERSNALFHWAIADLQAEPGRYFRLCLRRLQYFLWIDESNPKTASLFYQIPQKVFVIASAIAFIIMPATIRRQMQPVIIAFALTAVFHAATITAPRFHLPWEVLLIICISAGLQQLAIQMKVVELRLFSDKPVKGGYARSSEIQT